MPRHQKRDRFPGPGVVFQARKDFPGQLRAFLGVAVKMADPFPVQREARRLAEVVQEHRQAQDRLRFHGFQRPQRMLPHVVGMVRVALVEAESGADLRDEHRRDFAESPQDGRRFFSAEKPRELSADALRRHALEQRPVAQGGRGGFAFQRKAELRAEAQRPQHAQAVLPEAVVRVAHAADHARREVLLPAEKVDQAVRLAVGEGVHGEVPPCQVFRQAPREPDAVRMAAVGVGPVHAVGRHFHGRAAGENGHGAVLHARGDHGYPRENARRFLRQRVRRHVPVARCAAEKLVPHAAADQVRAVSARRKLSEDERRLGRYLKLHVAPSLSTEMCRKDPSFFPPVDE